MVNTTVFVSGATGFIALTLIKQLLERGYSFVGSVRSTEKGEYLKNFLTSDKFSYEVVESIEEEVHLTKLCKHTPK